MPMSSLSRATDYGSLLDLDAQVEQNKQARAAKQAEMSRDFTLADWLTSPDPYADKLKGMDIDLGDRYGPGTFPGKVVSGVESGLQATKDYLADAMSGQGALDYRDQQIKDKQRIAALPADQRGEATAESAINTAADWGGAGIMAGRMAKGANLAALEEAKALKSGGATPVETMSETGWREMAPDEWAFEIPDTGFKGRKDIPNDPKVFSDVFEHPKLYEAYPEMADMPLSLADLGSASGQYMPKRLGKEFGITLSPKSKDPSSAALHEMQHGVQDVEGMVGGTSEGMADNYRRLAINDLESQIADARGSDMYKAALKANRVKELGDRDYASLSMMEGAKLQRAARDATQRDMGVDALMTKRQELDEASGFGLYERDWGEATARMTQDRYEMARDMREAGVPEGDIDDALVGTPLKLDKDEGSLIDVYGNYQKLMDDESIPLGSMQESKAGWQKTSKEYDTLPEKKDMESIYIPIGGSKVEVVQNPSNADISSMSKEAEKQYGKSDVGDPVLRYTDDAEGNRYYWKASEAVHQSIEPALGTKVGAELSQNMGQRPTHRSVVRRALYDGEGVPDDIVGEYPGILEEVRDIPGNKAPGTLSESLMQTMQDTGGFSVDTITGRPPRREGFMVATDPNTNTGVNAMMKDPTAADLAGYMDRNKKALSEPGTFLGGWMDEGIAYVEPSKQIQDYKAAMGFGEDTGQIAGFDLNKYPDFEKTTGRKFPEQGMEFDIVPDLAAKRRAKQEEAAQWIFENQHRYGR